MTDVPCAGCTVCCKNELLILHPECGDNPEEYLTKETINPLTGKPALALQQKENGDCIYLADHGCSIHGNAPAICREFDCRRFYIRLGDRKERRKAIAQGFVSKDLYDAARKRLKTLGPLDA